MDGGQLVQKPFTGLDVRGTKSSKSGQRTMICDLIQKIQKKTLFAPPSDAALLGPLEAIGSQEFYTNRRNYGRANEESVALGSARNDGRRTLSVYNDDYRPSTTSTKTKGTGMCVPKVSGADGIRGHLILHMCAYFHGPPFFTIVVDEPISTPSLFVQYGEGRRWEWRATKRGESIAIWGCHFDGLFRASVSGGLGGDTAADTKHDGTWVDQGGISESHFVSQFNANLSH
eukprot:scaffold49254_cov52-Attheya_sp.AAC.5